jgi:glutaredoxin
VTIAYVNVQTDQDGLARMLEHSKGRREVPVIVDGGTVTVGYGGGS